MSRLSAPVRAAILETPAGFEPNSDMVAQKIADCLQHRLQNFDPRTELVAARQRGTAFSPDDPALAEPIFRANYVFMGPGSPTYAVRQLRDSFTWYSMLAQHRLGAAICFSSASTISVSKHALPVYEIYKVGEDLHWKAGLDFFSHFGLNLIITPHWNNNNGGDELDTSRCYMGQARYAELLAMLPEVPAILGIEENSGVVIDPISGECTVVGVGDAIIRREGRDTRYDSSSTFSVDQLGEWRLPQETEGIPAGVWERAEAVQGAMAEEEVEPEVPEEIMDMVAARELARRKRDWNIADELRDEVWKLGWEIVDMPDGPKLEKLERT